jgi:GTP cyclohydrolase IA
MKHQEIIQRIEDAGKRFFAKDNISEFILPGEKDILVDECTIAFENVLDHLIIDRKNDPNSKGTGRRLAKMYFNEIMSGRYDPDPAVTAFPNDVDDEYDEAYEGMIVIRAEIKSICSHHWQPVTGVCYIGVLPESEVIGLSKYIRIAQHHAKRGTLQEQLSTDIANSIIVATNSKNVAVHIGATHGCCENRGVMAKSSLTQSTVLKGAFETDPGTKKEFFDCLNLQRSSGNGVY